MTKFSTITQIQTDLSIKNSQKTGGGRKKQAIFGCFTTFYSSKVQNMLYLVREI